MKILNLFLSCLMMWSINVSADEMDLPPELDNPDSPEEPIAPENPDRLGQTASYELDKSGSRTTRMIKGGGLETEIANYTREDGQEFGTYEVSIDYNVKVRFFGSHDGEEKINLTSAYYTDAFMEDLRDRSFYEGDGFKVEYKGREDVKTKGGNRYENCDLIRIYDLDDRMKGKFAPFLASVAESLAEEKGFEFGAAGYRDDMTDLEIFVAYHPEVPAMGAATLDMRGKMKGFRFKVGFDYQSE